MLTLYTVRNETVIFYRAAERKRGEENFEIYVLLTQF